MVPKEQYDILKPFIEGLVQKGSARIGIASANLIFDQTGDKALLAFYKTGALSLNFAHLMSEKQEQLKELVQEYLPKIWQQPKFQREDLFKTYPSLTAVELIDNIEGLQKLFDEFLN